MSTLMPVNPVPSGSTGSSGRGKRVSLALAMQIAGLKSQRLTNLEIAQRLGLNRQTVGRVLARSKELDSRPVEPIHETTEVILARAGLTKDAIAKNYAELVQANETKLVTWEGTITEREVLPDNVTRLAANRDVAKMLDLFPSEANQSVTQLVVKLPSHKSIDDWNKEHAITTTATTTSLPDSTGPTST